jgi:T5SS/PEP-CTERM-associated repeat protein
MGGAARGTAAVAVSYLPTITSQTFSLAVTGSAEGTANVTAPAVRADATFNSGARLTFRVDAPAEFSLTIAANSMDTAAAIGRYSFGPNNSGEITSGSRTVSGTLVPGQVYGVTAGAYGLDDPLGAEGWGVVATQARPMRIGSGTYSFNLTIDAATNASIRWNNGAGGSFDTTTNWQPQVVPNNSGDAHYTAVFDLDADYGVALPSAVVTDRLVVRNSRVDFNLGQDWRLVGSAEELPSIAVGGKGRLNITAGRLRSNHGIIGADFDLDPDTGPTAEVLVANSSGSLNANGRLTIGDVGKGRLFVANGAVSSLEGRIGVEAPGEVIVGGRAANWVAGSLAVGHGNDASLIIENGGLVESTTSAINATGTSIDDADTEVIVQGVNTDGAARASLWRVTDELTIDNGTLRVRDGGRVLAAQGVSMSGDFNRVLVEGIHAASGKRSELVSEKSFVVGGEEFAFSFIDISNGAGMRITTGSLHLGWDGREGSATVSGVHSSGERSTLSGDIIVGSDGPGLLEVFDGALVSTGDAIVGLNSPGVVQIRTGESAIASTWSLTGDLEIGLPGDSQGTVTLSDATLSPSGGVTLGELGKLLGTGTVFGIVSNQGGEVAPGLSPGTLTIDGDYEQTSGLLRMEVAGAAPGQFDVLKVTGKATIGGELMIEFLDGFAPRQGDAIELLDFAGTLNGQFTDIEILNLAPEFRFDLRPEAGALTMIALNDAVFVPPAPSVWNIDASGNWSSAANWTVDISNNPGEVAVFGGKITAPRTVPLDVPITVGRIDLDSANAYTIAGSNTLTLNAKSFPEQINVINGSHTINAPLTLADNTKITVTPAASNLSITGAISASGVTLTKTGAGSLTLNNLRADGLTIDAGTVAIAPNGTAAGTSVLGALAIAGANDAWTAKLDLANNDLVVQSSAANKAADLAKLHNQLKQGFNNGDWKGLGVTTSTAATNTNADTGLAVVDNALLGYTTLSGQPVTADSILVKYTYYGDIDQNGQVDADDLTVFANSFGRTSGSTQVDGDIDFNGTVDADDLTVFANNFNKGVGNPLATATVQAVPEPSTCCLLAVAAIVFASRRRRRSVAR